MTPQELDRAYTKTLSDMSSHPRGEVMNSLGIVALVLIKQRVQEKGEDVGGQKYAPYSTKPMLANRAGMNVSAYNKVAGSKDKRKELKWVTIDGHKLFEVPGGYKQYRELHGRQTGFVDFSFSGRMWSNVALISSPADHNSGVAIIGAKNTETNDILEGNTKRRGDILDLSDKEIDELKEMYNLGMLKILKQNGL
jgi:hypothetical protein